ncbi:MAG: hypothetical protein M5U34_03920 [Chloroflexi bacterium]|nr:hypothetical protein [Chloroflexota bacterium]
MVRTVYRGQQIVSAGSIINPADVELLDELGLLRGAD